MNNNIITIAREMLEARHDRSAWNRAVTDDAIDMLDTLETAVNAREFDLDTVFEPRALRTLLLNGARNWYEFSRGGCALIYDCEIAERYCTPSELKRTRYGERRPNARETWLEVQARALFQAANRLFKALKDAANIPA